jgi:gluconolactonase
MMTTARVVASGFAFPEGPAFGRDDTLYLVNVDGGHLSRLAPGGVPEAVHPTGGRPNGLAIHADGTLYVADAGLRAVVRIDPVSGAQRIVCDAYRSTPLLGPNDLCFDRAGNLYFTDPLGSSVAAPTGVVYRLGADGQLRVVLDGLAFPNGLCLDATERVLYLAETWRHVVHACHLTEDGAIHHRHVHAEVDGNPDGMALDVEGRLYVALYGRGAIGVVPPEGGRVHHVAVHGPNPTNVAFLGSDLYVTEASAGTLQILHVGVPGIPLYARAVPA